MRCPFLRDEQVKSCQASPFRLNLARSASDAAHERCSSPEHASCPFAPSSHEAHPSPSRCAFLRESLVQFCAAAPVPAYVPWTSSPEARCGHDGHRYCELFRRAAGARALAPALPLSEPAPPANDDVSGVPVPSWLHFTENHLWLDVGDDGLWHLGTDAFLAQVTGRVERLAFLTVKGSARPAVVLTVRGVDLTLVFPCALAIVAANTRLRSSLERLTDDPYGLGWLFTVRAGSDDALRGLRRGAAARAWMAGEVRRASELVHARHVAGPERLAADGGRFAPDLLCHLEREDVLRLFADLFPIPDTRRTS